MAVLGDINRWELTGRMARDAEVQESNGRKRLRLRVAVHEAGPEGSAHFFTVVAFGYVEARAAAFAKGQAVRLSGRCRPGGTSRARSGWAWSPRS
jgi:single-stranded DNA-binding protein